jgi:16S rRNA (cytosine1407-C5)-methyltransferase
VGNAFISKAPGTVLARYFHNFFDRILLDAPCSGDGTVRKELSVLGHWSPERARYRAEGQAGLLRSAFHMLRPGGVLVYSTCSLSLEENEDVLLSLIKRYGDQVEILPITLFDSPRLPREYADRYPPEFAECVRVWPHLQDSEGAFVARIGKKGDSEPWRQAGDATSWLVARETDHLAGEAVQPLAEQFGCALAPMPGLIFSVKGRYLWLQHESASHFQEKYPYFVRSGLRIAKRHRGVYFLAQPAVTLWGAQMQEASVELDWLQAQALFRNNSVLLRQEERRRGVRILRHGEWALTRGLVQENGYSVQGLLPGHFLRNTLRSLPEMLWSNRAAA